MSTDDRAEPTPYERFGGHDFFVDLVRKKARQYEFQRAIEQLAIKKIDKVCAYIAAEA